MTMEPRLSQPHVMLVPGSLEALQNLHKAITKTGLPQTTIELAALRASQINGCSFCVHMHARDLRKAGEPDERTDTVAAWRESPWFTDAERVALEVTECVTRLADAGDPVPDELWARLSDHYDEPQIAALVLAISSTNVWNRLNAATRQPAGSVPS